MDASKKINYPQLMATVGQYIAKKGLNDVCVMEFENGIIIVGSVVFESAQDTGRHSETHVLSLDELQRMARGG